MVILIMANVLNYSECFNLLNKYRNFILLVNDDYYHYEEYKKNKYNYIRYFYGYNKLLNIEYYNYSGELHRKGGPVIIWYNTNGKKN